MKNPLPFLLAALLPLATLAQTGTTPPITKQFDRTLGGSGDDQLSVVLPTADGGYLLGGYSASGVSATKSAASFGGNDYWVVKLNADGSKAWDQTLGGSGDDRLTAMQQTADGGYIVGGRSNSGAGGSKSQGSKGGLDVWVLKLDATGNKLWDTTLGSNTDDLLTAVQLTPDGGYILGAQSDSGPSGDRSQPGHGSLDYWLIKLDATGTKTWDRSLGGSSNDVLNAVQPTADGGYVLGGFSYSPASGDKSQNTRGAADYDFWVLKTDATGAKVWDTTLGGTGFDNLTSLALAADGGVVAGGFSNSPVSGEKTQPSRGDYDFWVVKLGGDGSKTWDYTLGGDGYDQLGSVATTTDGGFVVGGQSQSGASGDRTQPNFGPPGSPDYWLVQLAADGQRQFDVAFGGGQDDVLSSVRQTADFGYVLGGFSNSGISGSKSEASLGGFDWWVVRLAPVVLATTPVALAAPFTLFPNPAHRAFSLQLPASAPRTTAWQVQLLDATGRLVWQQAAPTPADGLLPVAPGPLPAGLYLLRLQGAGGYLQTQRLVLE